MITRWLCIFSLYLFAVGTAFGEGTYQRTKDGKTIVWNDDPKPGDTATWAGDRDAEGYASRIGTLTWHTARGTIYARFRGNMVRGKFNGTVNGYSKGKSGHALFVAGHRTTRWVAGTSGASEVVQAPTPPAKTPNQAKAERTRTVAAPSGGIAPDQVKPEPNESASEKLLRKIAAEQDREKTRPTITTVEPHPVPENFAPNVEPASEPTRQNLSNVATNEVASHPTPSSPPAATPEKLRDEDESSNAEPEAPAEGIPEAPSATASTSSPGEQAIEEKPPPSAPEEVAVNGPATSEKPPDDSVPPATSSNRKTEMVTSPQTRPSLTTERVIMLANAELRKRRIDRKEYVRQEPRFDADHRAWSVAYDPMTFDGIETAGQHISVVIDDRTRGAVFLLRK